MGTQEKIICRLCLKICENFQNIEANMKNVFKMLLLKIDLAAIQEPVMCTNCAEILLKCFDFKTMCLYTSDYIFPFISHVVKLDLTQVYLDQIDASIPENQDICGFCMKPVKKCFAISLDVGEGDIKLKNMIEQCLPELDLSIIEKPVICVPCHGSLENCFRFVTNCLIVNERIKKYCETLDKNNKCQVKLSNSLEFTIRDVPTSEVDGNLVDVIEVEKQFCEENENADENEIVIESDTFKLEQILYDDCENAKEEVKYKNKSYMDMDNPKSNSEEHFTLTDMLAYEEDNKKFDRMKLEETFCEENEVKEETLDEMEDQQFLLKEEIEIKTDEHDFNSFQEIPTSSQLITIYNPEEHMVTDQALSEVKIENLENLNDIKFNHQNPLKVTQYKHQIVSAMTVYNCDQCSYKTKYNSILKNHMLIHRQLSEGPLYKCQNCVYVTKCKSNLKRHNKIHRSLKTEYNIYNCGRCSFETKYKSSLKKHMLMHGELPEVTVYTCESCSYVTRHKKNLKLHMLVHKKLSDVTVYKCEYCAYITDRKGNLNSHRKHIHRSLEYNCERCSFKTKYKQSLKYHRVIHQERSEVTFYKCESCEYKSARKGNLQSHQRIHQFLEITISVANVRSRQNTKVA